MALKMRCQEVRKLIESMPRRGHQEILRQISGHLSQCEGCRNLHANFRRIEEGLIARKRHLDRIASRVRMNKSRVLAEIATIPHARSPWFLRPAWAGAGVLILIAAGALAIFLSGGGIKRPRHPGIPTTTRVMPDAGPAETLKELAEVLSRREAPSPELPYTPEAFTYEPFYPTSIQQYIEPEDTLTTLAQTTINLSRREET